MGMSGSASFQRGGSRDERSSDLEKLAKMHDSA
jgi:hypothetical protein